MIISFGEEENEAPFDIYESSTTETSSYSTWITNPTSGNYDFNLLKYDSIRTISTSSGNYYSLWVVKEV